MKRLYPFLVLLLCIPLFSSCELYGIWLISELNDISWEYDDGVDKYVYFDKEGGEEFVKTRDDYKFYLVRVQSDTIYWQGDDRYKQRSIANGYTFESDNRYIAGDGLILDGTYETKFKVEMTRNPYHIFRHVDVHVVPSNYEVGDSDEHMKFYVITQDYYDDYMNE